MKNLLKIIVLLSLVGGFFSSCQKENLIEAKSIYPKITKIKVLDNIESVTNPVNIKEYTYNTEDSDDEKINNQILSIAIATREYLKINSQNELIMKRANLSSNKCFNLNELASVNSLKSASKEYLNLISIIEKTDLRHKSTNPLKSGVVEVYVPAIYIVNLETADMDKQPLICPGFEVNSEIAGLEDFEDYAVAWFYDKNDSLNEILINEEIALNTTHPVFVIDNAEEELIYKEKSALVQPNFPTLKSTMLWTEIKTLDFQINYRYEGSGNSEFCITAILIDESGEHLKCLNYGADVWTEISEVGKNYIGEPLFHWEEICSNDLQPLTSNFIFWNTYERDWINSSKSLGIATRNGKTIELSGNRRYSDEWYGIDPNQLNNNPLDITYIFGYNSKMYENSKGHLKFYKYES